MSSYHRLTQADRYQIQALFRSKLSLRQIASQLRRSPSSISRELKRNQDRRGRYRTSLAQAKCQSRRAHVGPSLKIQGFILEHVKQKLELKWSPEQISGELLKNHHVRLSHEAIYQFIYRDYQNGGELYLHLRRKRKLRRSRLSSRNYKKCGQRKDRRWIDERERIVEQRTRLGDFERDTMEGTKGSCLLLTLVDRVSKLTKIRWVQRKSSALIHQATIEALSGLEVNTITNDNGPEFGLFEMTEKILNAPVYFSHPYHSWERGTNENTNGLIRQFFPVGIDPDPRLVPVVEDLLNHRPRKCLGYRTPYQVHLNKSGVALSF